MRLDGPTICLVTDRRLLLRLPSAELGSLWWSGVVGLDVDLPAIPRARSMSDLDLPATASPRQAVDLPSARPPELELLNAW